MGNAAIFCLAFGFSAIDEVAVTSENGKQLVEIGRELTLSLSNLNSSVRNAGQSTPTPFDSLGESKVIVADGNLHQLDICAFPDVKDERQDIRHHSRDIKCGNWTNEAFS